MISGARELLTPRAWRKEGYTFKLNDAPKPPTEPERESMPHAHSLNQLRIALWTYARGHGGRFPQNDKVPEIPDEVWRVPDPSDIQYVYVGGQTADRGSTPLAWEPGIFGKDRLVLFSSGEIRRMNAEEIRKTRVVEGSR